MCALLSDSGGACRQTLSRRGVVCTLAKTLTPTLSISELNHTAPMLAVYASCRPHERRRKTRFRRWSALPGGIIPQGSIEEFPPYMASLPPELTGAMRVRSGKMHEYPLAVLNRTPSIPVPAGGTPREA